MPGRQDAKRKIICYQFEYLDITLSLSSLGRNQPYITSAYVWTFFDSLTHPPTLINTLLNINKNGHFPFADVI